MGFFTYIIQSEKTKRLDKRLKYHNADKNTSTKPDQPWKIVYFEQLRTKAEAWKRERQIKSYKGGEAFKKLLK